MSGDNLCDKMSNKFIVSVIKKLSPKEFPPLLREITDPPAELYLEGEWPGEDFTYLTIVGSRKFSHYGREACEKIVAELAGYPLVIVSGLALGIDTLAHEAALAARLKTIAVPGSGLDRSVIHPHSNCRLADKIAAGGGALLSEFPPAMPAGLHTFPRRNRLMAGLAKASLIIEAGERSGTLITARLALEYGRDVLAVPGPIFSLNSIGTNRLIKQGAGAVTSGADVLEALGFAPEENNQRQLNLTELTPEERKLIDLLIVENLTRDELIRQLNFSVSEANALIAVLEIKGVIKEVGGEMQLLI